ncbi:hypothetical protein QA601_18165 [Chitinispirillales bacterium ANBcel5]|uniref:hypothetical protein n=1 Tax=Cellulosispirillum alkaliphilum TaxID=3039283 RepID=UPI002A53E0FD|nr:hypothetical protein [Chitinispirillales bacterium ANBcel5]
MLIGILNSVNLKICIVCMFVFFSFFNAYSCSQNSNSILLSEASEFRITDKSTNSDQNKTFTGKDHKNVIYSTKNFENAELIKPTGDAHMYERLVKLPPELDKFKIHVLTGGDNIMYYLQSEHLENFDFSASLDVSPIWEEPCEDCDYRKKHFEVYSNYTIRIDTEQRLDGEISEYTNFFRIDDEGNFYEIEKPEL